MLNPKQNYDKTTGMLLFALIISIIVIIILAAIVMGVALYTPERAGKARFIADLAIIQQVVKIKRAENVIPIILGKIPNINEGFTKIQIKKKPGGVVEDGWVVNLDTIMIRNSTLGRAYKQVTENSIVSFGPDAPDIYVYDGLETVYYARGYADSVYITYSPDYITKIGDKSGNWMFDTETGTIYGYVGKNVNELIIPDYINGVKVNSIKGNDVSGKGIIYGKVIPKVIVSNGIEYLGKNAFAECGGLINIVIPESVLNIGELAFSGCRDIETVTIPSGITTIEPYAFSGCTGINTINMANGITTIKEGAFYGCTELDSITLPDSVTVLGTSAFEKCTDLDVVVLSNQITTIREGTFNNCTDINSVVIPNGIINIENYAFQSCNKLREITIPSSILNIANFAFSNSKSLTKILINKPQGTISGNPPWGAPKGIVTWML